MYWCVSDYTGLSIGSAIIVIGYLSAMVVLFKLRPQYFGDYKRGFKDDTLSQLHYWLLTIDRILLGCMLVFVNNVDFVGYICLPIPILAGLYVCIKRPYLHLYNNIRQAINQLCVIIILVIYAYYRQMVSYT
jgi:hypothetical protein